MTIKEIYENEVESGKITVSEQTLEEIGLFETKLRLFDTQSAGQDITLEFSAVFANTQQEAYVQGFKAGVQLMADCFNGNV